MEIVKEIIAEIGQVRAPVPCELPSKVEHQLMTCIVPGAGASPQTSCNDGSGTR